MNNCPLALFCRGRYNGWNRKTNSAKQARLNAPKHLSDYVHMRNRDRINTPTDIAQRNLDKKAK